jgi:opacity protein-like surface antigen
VYARVTALRAAFSAHTDLAATTVSDPEDRTGWAWGAGFRYAVAPRVAVGSGYSQEDVRLQKIDSYPLSVQFELL